MDRNGDKEKQPLDCPPLEKTKCPHITQTYQGYNKETWECPICGERFNLYYEDMA